MDKFTIENMNLYYGKFHALKDVNIRMKKTESQPSSVRQAAVSQLF